MSAAPLKPLIESGHKQPLEERLQGLAAFLQNFDNPDFSLGELIWKAKTGESVLPYFSFSSEGQAFVDAAYNLGWVVNFDWGAWMETKEAESLFYDPASLPHASSGQLEKIVTALVRQERFCDGTLVEAFRSGLLKRIAQRAAALWGAGS